MEKFLEKIWPVVLVLAIMFGIYQFAGAMVCYSQGGVPARPLFGFNYVCLSK